jgi:RNA-directed DNA polymerase
VKDRTNNGIGAEGKTSEWELQPWLSIEKSIRKLRQRIFRASREQKWNVVRSLMKLMLRSYLNLLESVRRVTQKNKGKQTAGVDGEVALDSKARMALVRSMGKYTLWKVKPTRRVYIPKAGKPAQNRPLGIPTIRNRVAQAIVKNALEPCWEAQFESNSYGFRPGRSAHDAIQHCWLSLNGKCKRPWILDADIKGAFDNISHNHILNAIGPIPGRGLIKQWLKAGYVEAEIFHATENGTPQGGVISPCLLNVALNGLQQTLGSAYGYIRYADDLIICASTHEQIETAKSILEEWLQQRGLALHPEKTRIVHINDGFNFLSFLVKRYGGKCLIKPQKAKVLAFLAKLRWWLNKHKQATAENVIRYFNPILRGWTNYYKTMVSKEAFSYVLHKVWKMLWKWCLRRHPEKGKHWVAKKYFNRHENAHWRFQAHSGNKILYLFDVGSVKIERHIKVKGAASPDDPALQNYWQKRQEKRKTRSKLSKVTKAQSWAGSEARAV